MKLMRDEGTRKAAEEISKYVKEHPDKVRDAMERQFMETSIYLASRLNTQQIDHKALLKDLMKLDKKSSGN